MESTDKKINILIAEDDINLGYLLKENLLDKGFETVVAVNGRKAIEAIQRVQFDLCILDVMLPEEDGFAVANYLMANFPGIPFVFLTARVQEQDKIQGFESGAEDYIIKPFSFKELLYRIKVILRRQSVQQPSAVKSEILLYGNTILDSAERTLEINGKIRKISNRESNLLFLLMQNKGNYLSRSEILKQIWGRDDYFTAKSMDVFLTRLRKLLKDDESLEIENLYGSGYRIRAKI
jgi:two-component system, OmpR family, response regulator